MRVNRFGNLDRLSRVRLITLGAAYFINAAVAEAFTRHEGGVALIWIATALLVTNLRNWPSDSWWLRCGVCAVAGMAATSFFGLGPAAALPLAIINIGEALIATWLLQRFMPAGSHLESPREIAILALVSGFIAPVVSAFPAAATAEFVAGVPYWVNWTGWASGHALGALTVLPLAKLLVSGDVTGWIRRAKKCDRLEAGIIAIAMVGTTAYVFIWADAAFLFLPLLPMMAAVFRMGRVGAAGSLAILTIIATWSTMTKSGPIAQIAGDLGNQIQFLQFYLVSAMLMTLPAAAELKRRQKLLMRAEESAALFHLIADRTGDIILAMEADGAIRYASPSISSIVAGDAEHVTGRKIDALAFEGDVDEVRAAHRRMMRVTEASHTVEFRVRKVNGDIGWFEAQGRAAVDNDGATTGIVSILREVSRRKARELDLAREASTDALTGLLNRRALKAAIERHATTGSASPVQGCLAIFDLDYFKSVNDRFGHAVGDEVLRAFAHVLLSAIREEDIAARVGGEEFVCYLPGVDLLQGAMICERVRDHLARAVVTHHGRSLRATVSVGIASLAPDQSLEDAMHNADVALYEAKNAGRNRVALAA